MLTKDEMELSVYKELRREIKGDVEVYDLNNPPKLIDTLLPSENLVSIEIDKAAPQGKFFGFVVSQKITVTALNELKYQKGMKMVPSIYELDCPPVVQSDFYIDEVSYNAEKNTTTIIGYDIFQKAKETLIEDSLNITLPITAQEYANKIGEALGCNIIVTNFDDSDTFAINPTFNKINTEGKESLLDMIIALTEITGSVCSCRQNSLMFAGVNTSPYSVDSDILPKRAYFTLDRQEGLKLSKISIATQLGNNLSVGDDTGVEQIIWDNPFLELYESPEEILKGLQKQTSGIIYIPFNLKFRGNPYYEAGDLIRIEIDDAEFRYLDVHIYNGKLIYNGGLSGTYDWAEASTKENIKTNPATIGETIKQTYAVVDKVNKTVDIVASDVANNKEEIGQLKLTTTDITASVKKVSDDTSAAIKGTNENISKLEQSVAAKMTEEQVNIAINKSLANGVNKVTTTTGFTFNEEGLTVNKSGSQMSTQITEDGMKIFRDSTEVLTANNRGVDAQNLHATTYLIIGTNSRFEDYNSNRTGCFWIGG